MKKIVYWSPFISKIATVKAVLNSAKALSNYSNNLLDVEILNVCGEFDEYKKNTNLKFRDLSKFSISKFLSDKGFFLSRVSFVIIFLYSLFPLLNFLKKKKPDYLVIHLITILPLLINFFFKLDTKIILRISGLPKIIGLRKILWKFLLPKVSLITCPSKKTVNDLVNQGFVDERKIFLLSDPIIEPKDAKNKINENLQLDNHKYIFSAGRLTKQKNFSFLINCFKTISQKHKNLILIIAGDGEEYFNLTKLINNLELKSKIKLIGYKKNIYKYMKNSFCFILPSLWEDPGFVLVEALFSRCSVIASDCPNGPKEILSNGEGGYLFESNNLNSFHNTFEKFLKDREYEKEKILRKKIIGLKNIKKFSLFNHYDVFSKIILENSKSINDL